MTSQQIADAMLEGWNAARRGYPYDHHASWHWQSGWLAWCEMHD